MADNLRDRIASVISHADGNNEIDPCDLRLADAVVGLLIDMAGKGELLKAIDRMHRD